MLLASPLREFRSQGAGGRRRLYHRALPRNEALSHAWQTEFGPEWQRVHDTWLHKIGNLTFGYNSEYSDKPFVAKRDLSEIGLRWTSASTRAWDRSKDGTRGLSKPVPRRLATSATAVWPAPSLPADALTAHEDKAVPLRPTPLQITATYKGARCASSSKRATRGAGARSVCD
jgi:hypothetical protein